ncbi:hypothetical protein RJ55_06598 [Drechmeria coniospora]|nr:hypothetical protein RJ55_06598 [Drechmeria coniospora]
MSSSATSKDDVVSELASLSLARGRDPKRAGERLAKMEVADSWEDEDDEDNEDNEDDEKDDRDCRGDVKRATAGSGTETPTAGSESILPSAPSRPTAASAYDGSDVPDWNSSLAPAGGGRRNDTADRPEKTDAVARRMIAAGLGLKAPKQTEEQRAYQRSVREQEKKRREQEREQERKRREEAERAKAAVWDD